VPRRAGRNSGSPNVLGLDWKVLPNVCRRKKKEEKKGRGEVRDKRKGL